jgi:hypothetical protein
VKSWLDISQDPVIGNEQTSNTFWEQVRISYMEARGTTMHLANAFHNCWRVIQQNVSKFSVAWAAIEGKNASRKAFDDKVRDSCTLYQMQNQTAFTMLSL